MKHLFWILLLSPLTLNANDLKTIKSKIQSVTVYQKGAQINRKAYYSVSKGITTISIENISRQIDIKSIQVNGTGEMIILDSKYNLKYPAPDNTSKSTILSPALDKELVSLQDSNANLDYELLAIQQKMDVLSTQKSILSNNGAIKGIGKVNDSIPLLKEALLFYYDKMNAINAEMLTRTIEKNKLMKTKHRITKRISDIQVYKNNKHHLPAQAQTPISAIEVTLSANANVSGKLEISYMVNNAGWTPLYDIRSNSKISSIDLTYKAHVYQNTGTDWINTNLTLSTSNPYSNKTKPNLTPHYVQYYTNQRLIDRDQSATSKKYNRELNETDMEEDKEIKSLDMKVSTGKLSGNEVASLQSFNYVQRNEQLISVEYEVNLPYSILSNNEQHLVLVRQETLKSNYKYYTVPKLDASAYLVAELTNLADLDLIPGTANVFHNGSYIGETTINPSIMEDSLALSLGKDQNLQVKRTLLQKDSKTRVIGDKTIRTYAYLIEIKNHKSTTTEITLQDQVPVSRDSDITIEIEEINKGKLTAVTGIINWDLKLKPRETHEVKLIYTVTTDKNKASNLAQN